MRQFCASAVSEIAQTPIVKAKRNASFIDTLHKMENRQGGSHQSNKQNELAARAAAEERFPIGGAR
jgi:hypothetical protein